VDCAGPVHRGLAAIATLGSSPELGLRPFRCPRAQWRGERKGGPANSMAGLPRLERRWKGVSLAVELRSREDDSEGAVRALEVWEASPRVGSAFIGRRQGRASSMAGVEGASMARMKAPVTSY
jgi:hypothetical protein